MLETVIRAGEWLLRGGSIRIEDVVQFLGSEGEAATQLWAYGSRVRERFAPPGVEMCSVISVHTGGCSEDCAFCAQAGVPFTGEPTDAEVLEQARALEAAGVRRVCLVASGRGHGAEAPLFKRVLHWATLLRRETGLRLCASLGNLEVPALAALREVGVERYNHNLEAAASFFHRVVSSHAYEERVATIRAAWSVGLLVCVGGILGMGESHRQRVELAFALRELPVMSVPLNIVPAHSPS